MSSKNTIGIYINDDQRKKWEALAKDKGMSLSSFVRQAVESYILILERYKKKQEKR